jgi:hypothetical protein
LSETGEEHGTGVVTDSQPGEAEPMTTGKGKGRAKSQKKAGWKSYGTVGEGL